MKDAINRGSEFRCPTCNRPNEETNFDSIMKIQGVCVHFHHPTYTVDTENTTQRTECYYSDSRRRVKDKKCFCPFGNRSYDDDDAMNDEVFNPWEALNSCTMCGINCHRMCAGSPWSKYTFDGEGEEPPWQCDDCRGCNDAIDLLETETLNSQPNTMHIEMVIVNGVHDSFYPRMRSSFLRAITNALGGLTIGSTISHRKLEKVKPRGQGCMSILAFMKPLNYIEKHADVSKKRKSDVAASSSLCPPKQARIKTIPENVEDVQIIGKSESAILLKLENSESQDKEKHALY
uniref:PHD-type domain-containing protein n=1 Tax=Heterorhabditis bacteriophora TaxID=37862 RepID=A0A1I7XIH1_HETBA